MLVSIIIPTFNRRKLIHRAVNSCLKQQYKNIEIIICDDHSTDDTGVYIKKWMEEEPRIVYCTTPEGRKGANAARNAGIKIAKGRYFCFLDSDDELLENGIIDRVRVFEDNDELGMVYGDAYCHFLCSLKEWKFIELSTDLKDARKCLLKEMSLCSQTTMMIRRDYFINVGELDEEQRGWTDDGAVMMIAMHYPIRHCGKFVVLNHSTPNSMVSNKRNLQKGLGVLIKKYRNEIISEVSLWRYFLWKFRYLGALFYANEKESKNEYLEYFWMCLHNAIKNRISSNFRNYFE